MIDNIYKLLNKLTIVSKIVILLLILMSLFITKSIYLILFFTVIQVIFIIISNKSVKEYVNLLKQSYILLLIILFTYIMIYSNFQFELLLFLYKLLLAVLYISMFFDLTNFFEFYCGVFTILSLFCKKVTFIESISLEVSMFFYLAKQFFISKLIVKQYGNYSINAIKLRIIARIEFSIEKFVSRRKMLEYKYFRAKKVYNNFISTIFIIIFLILFVISIIKEVIR